MGLLQNDLVPHNKQLRTLNRFIDENNILRVGGRIRHASKGSNLASFQGLRS